MDQHSWVRKHCPIIVQPIRDVEVGYGLVGVYYEFFNVDGCVNCRLCVLYKGEGSYNCKYPDKHNAFATWCYRTYNRVKYKRTADVNYLEYRDVDLAVDAKVPFKSIFTTDCAGQQTWSMGHNGVILNWFSLMRHYTLDMKYESLEYKGCQPVLYLNTCNHMWGDKDNNVLLAKKKWHEYPLMQGSMKDAENYAIENVSTKWNFFSIFCCCFARNGGGYGDRVIH